MKTRQQVFFAACISMLAMTSGCTTTQHVTQTQPVLRNTAPSAMSEQHIAEIALESGNLDMATALYDKIVAADPRSVAGLTGLGDTLYAVGDFTRAGVYYQRAVQVDPKALQAMVGIARVAIHQRRFDDAISTYQKVLVLTPDNPMASAGLGAALDLKGAHAAAQTLLRQALKDNPGDPNLSINLGLSLVLGGNPREGANVLLDVTRYPGAAPQARQDLALAYGLLGNADAAAEILGRDLPKASVQDNLRFYEIQRQRLAGLATSKADPAPPKSADTASIGLPVDVLPVYVQAVTTR